MTTLHLVRHGAVANPDNVLYLRLPGIALSAQGHRQARVVARVLALRPVVAVYSSPMPRAVQTADYIAFEHGLVVQTAPLINEIHSPYQGWPLERIERTGYDLYSSVSPGYETWADVLARTQDFCREMGAAHPDADVIAVTHGDIIITAAMWAEGLPLEHGMRARLPYPGHASITSLHFASPGARPTRTYDDPFT